MNKNNFLILLSLLLVISLAQLSEKDSPLNSPRKLQSSKSETILLGYDNYNFTYDSSTKQSNFKFSIYFLLKNWNYTTNEIIYNEYITFNDITLKSIIYYQSDDKGTEAEFNCSKVRVRPVGNRYYRYPINEFNYYVYSYYYYANYSCYYNLTGRGIPKKINITTNFTNDIYLNTSKVSYVSSSAEALERDLVSLKYGKTEVTILENATFISQNPNSFKIKGEGLDDDFNSENIYLITTVNGSPKKISCSGKQRTDSSSDEPYYHLETKGSNHLAGADLNYALLNFTKARDNYMAVLDFTEDQKNLNGTILPPKVDYKKNSGGLSTGGIIAIVIPAVLVLLGVGALAYFLSRRAVPSPPIKNIGNNTMGVVASSEAVVHQ